jgi:hypothetical protein
MMHSLLQHEHGGRTVLRRLHLDFDLPDEVLAHLRDEDIAMKAKEALVMELLREHHLYRSFLRDMDEEDARAA